MWPFRSKTLEGHLNQEKTVVVSGIRFKIRKISMINYLDGSAVLKRVYDTYKITQNETELIASKKKIKELYRDVIMASVVKPVLSRKANDGTKIWVDDIFKDWELATNLYGQILLLTYGKKKLK